jgi:hypothetical protein
MNNSPIEIISGIWIGDINSAYNKNFFINNNIEIIFNCTNDTETIQLNTIKHVIKIPFSINHPSKHNIEIINEYIGQLLDIMNKTIDNHNIFIYSYNTAIIPLHIVSLFIVKYGKINIQSIEDVIKSKIDINKFNQEICIDLSLYQHFLD